MIAEWKSVAGISVGERVLLLGGQLNGTSATVLRKHNEGTKRACLQLQAQSHLLAFVPHRHRSRGLRAQPAAKPSSSQVPTSLLDLFMRVCHHLRVVFHRGD